MKNIRNSVFETNSSSTHSISICSGCDTYDTLVPDDDGNIILTGGQFGWEWETYTDPQTKANYAAIYCSDSDGCIPELKSRASKYKEMLIDVIKKHTGAKDVVFDFSTTDYDHEHYSYIDHQSAIYEGGRCDLAFKDEETLKNFLFNPASELKTGNDNEEYPYYGDYG